VSTDLFLEPSVGQRKRRPVDVARDLDRLMECAGGCGKKFRVGPMVSLVICGRPCCSLTGVRDRMDQEKRKRGRASA
jgi:hypothetical protein